MPQCYHINQINQQLLINMNRKKYYLSIIKKNNYFAEKLPKKYPPQYYWTAYKGIIYPNISNVPN